MAQSKIMTRPCDRQVAAAWLTNPERFAETEKENGTGTAALRRTAECCPTGRCVGSKLERKIRTDDPEQRA
jgi:hypothetical protein